MLLEPDNNKPDPLHASLNEARYKQLLLQIQKMEAAQADLKAELLKDLPNASDMVSDSINMCLDNINQGIQVEHYKQVLVKLSKITKR